jgi:hypothetical protein
MSRPRRDWSRRHTTLWRDASWPAIAPPRGRMMSVTARVRGLIAPGNWFPYTAIVEIVRRLRKTCTPGIFGVLVARSVWSAPHPGALASAIFLAIQKRRDAAHSKRFAPSVAALPRCGVCVSAVPLKNVRSGTNRCKPSVDSPLEAPRTSRNLKHLVKDRTE